MMAPTSSRPNGDELISVIILCANQLAYTRQCLESVLRCTRPPFELILIDNASSDGTSAYLESLQREHGPTRVRVVTNNYNRGFSGGCNQGIAEALGRFLLFLNNDTVVSAGWVEGLVEAAIRHWPGTGLVGPVSNSTAPPQLVPIPYGSLSGLEAFAARRRREFAGQTPLTWRLTGLCLLACRELFDRIGSFDERFGFGYFEDYDLCARVHHLGLELVLAPSIFVHHFGGQTFSGLGLDRTDLLGKAYRLFLAKWGPETTARYAPDFLPATEVIPYLSCRAKHHIALGYQQMGYVLEAERFWRLAIDQEPTFAPAWLGLADLLLTSARIDEVCETSQRLQAVLPHSLEAYVLRARMDVTARNRAALNALDDVLRAAPASLEPVLQRCRQAVCTPDWPAADRAIAEVIQAVYRMAPGPN
ncbi:MAG TPA: glycosyltransferase [Gemmataceae bacterium]|nr:glycosyltransferase [Gemmataceae bacterium]